MPVLLRQIDHAHLFVRRVPSASYTGVPEHRVQQILPMPPAGDAIVDEKPNHNGSRVRWSVGIGFAESGEACRVPLHARPGLAAIQADVSSPASRSLLLH